MRDGLQKISPLVFAFGEPLIWSQRSQRTTKFTMRIKRENHSSINVRLQLIREGKATRTLYAAEGGLFVHFAFQNLDS